MQQVRTNIAYYQGRFVTEAEFLQHVSQVRKLLPDNTATGKQGRVLNLCEDRYHFLVLFLAAMMQDYITVMPANQTEGELARLLVNMPDALVIGDADIEAIGVVSSQMDGDSGVEVLLNSIDANKQVAELYTSGSTGMPMANLKCWGELVHGAKRVAARFGLDMGSGHTVVATVPPQHMFGFEMSIVLPLVCGVTVHHGKPFYPYDIRQALSAVPTECILVTTPLHLKASASLDESWPAIDFILSATAALPVEVAQAATDVLKAPVHEIYGCSEIGAIATRTLLDDSNWELLGDFQLHIDDVVCLHSSILAAPLVLPDQIKMVDDGSFRLVGRMSDMIKIGGKRGSLSEISGHIKRIAGVVDAIVFVPPQASQQRIRLAALVVAPGLSVKLIRQQLAYHVDPLFLPRQISLVEQLPYNLAGKLPQVDLVSMLECNRERAC